MLKKDKRKQKAFKYYCMGLNSKEIAKLLDISFRTVQSYMLKENWNEKRKVSTLKSEVLRYYELGYTYKQLIEMFGVSRATIYNYLKDARKFKKRKK